MFHPKLVLPILLGISTMCSSTFYMVDEATNDLWQLSTATGTATRVLDLGIDVNEVSGLAYDTGTEKLYLATVLADDGIPYLFEIDRNAGSVTNLMQLPSEVAGLSWDATTDTLIGIASILDPTNLFASKAVLYEIDVDISLVTERDVIVAGEDPFLGQIVTGSMNGAAIDPSDGALYATLGSLEGNNGVRLYKLTKVLPGGDYRAEILGTMQDGSEASQRWGLGFESEQLYGISGDDNNLYAIDKTDGSIEVVGPLGVNVGPAIGAAGGIPKTGNNDGSGGGDPHFHTFAGEHYQYHGICDLVMVHSDMFGDGAGISVHVRTVERESYSSISNAAIQIGDDVLEIVNDGRHFLNGEVGVEFPLSLGGKYVVHKKDGVESDVFHPDVSHGFLPEELPESTLYDIQIAMGQSVQIQRWDDYLWVNVRGEYDNFKDSVGLMGSWGTDRRMARNGITLLNDVTEFAEEWQVQESEPMLFQTARAPQHPAKCLPAPETAVARRRLGYETKAEEACSNVTGPQHEFCIFDILATGNIGLGRAYEAMEKQRKEGWAS